VLGLLTVYSQADVLIALERAVRYGAYAAESVERILASQSRPMGLLERLATEGTPPEAFPATPTIEPRSTEEYQPLLFEEFTDAPPNENEASRSDPERTESPDTDEPSGPDGSDEECPF
jgi:hypothetical protein